MSPDFPKTGSNDGVTARLPVALALVEDVHLPWLRDALQGYMALLNMDQTLPLPALLTKTGASFLFVQFPLQTGGVERLRKLHEAFPQLQIIGLGPVQDQGALLEAMRARVVEYQQIGVTANLRQAIGTLLQREQWQRPQKRQRLLSLCGRSGSGCTTVASNVALILKKQSPRHSILLLDFGSPVGDAMLALGLKPNLTFAEAAANLARCDASYLNNGITSTSSGIAVLPMFREISDLRGLRIQDALQLLNILLTLFDVVLADIGGATHTEVGHYLLNHADNIVVFTDQSVRGMIAAQALLAELREKGTDVSRSVRLVITHYDGNLPINAKQISAELGVSLLGEGILGERRAVLTRALNEGKAIIDLLPKDPFSQQLEAIAAQLGVLLWPEEADQRALTGSRRTFFRWNRK